MTVRRSTRPVAPWSCARALRPQLIDTRSEDRFLDSLVLAFRAVPGEPDRATLVVEGLQTPSGAAAVRGRPARPPVVSEVPKSAEPAKPTPAESEAKARSRDEVRRARRRPPRGRHPGCPASGGYHAAANTNRPAAS